MKPTLIKYLLSVAHETKSNKNGQIPESTILQTTECLAKILWLPPVLTYEWIVLLNPLDTSEQITFSSGKIIDAEVFFYKTHADIEKLLFLAVSRLFSIYTIPQDDKWEIIWLLKDIESYLDDSVKKMAQLYRWLDPIDFQAFRAYFQPIAFRNLDGTQYPWPSGASSAAFPTIDLLFGIAERPSLWPLVEAVMPRLSNQGYTTIQELTRARALVIQHGNIHSRFMNDPEITELVEWIVKVLKKFRISHRSVVTKFLPEAMENNISGTGGAMNVPHYLDTVIWNTNITN